MTPTKSIKVPSINISLFSTRLRYHRYAIKEHFEPYGTNVNVYTRATVIDTHSVLSTKITLRLSDLLFEHVDLSINVVEVMVVRSRRGDGRRGVGGEPLLQRGRRGHRRRQPELRGRRAGLLGHYILPVRCHISPGGSGSTTGRLL